MLVFDMGLWAGGFLMFFGCCSWAAVSTWPFGEVIPAGFSACVPVDQDMVPWTADHELIWFLQFLHTIYMLTFR